MKKLLIILTYAAILFTFTSCKTKTECFWCGEEKYCEESEVIDETVFICRDCLEEIESEFANK